MFLIIFQFNRLEIVYKNDSPILYIQFTGKFAFSWYLNSCFTKYSIGIQYSLYCFFSFRLRLRLHRFGNFAQGSCFLNILFYILNNAPTLKIQCKNNKTWVSYYYISSWFVDFFILVFILFVSDTYRFCASLIDTSILNIFIFLVIIFWYRVSIKCLIN